MSQQALDLRRSIQIVRRHKAPCRRRCALGILAGLRLLRAQPAAADQHARWSCSRSRSQSCGRSGGQPATADPIPSRRPRGHREQQSGALGRPAQCPAGHVAQAAAQRRQDQQRDRLYHLGQRERQARRRRRGNRQRRRQTAISTMSTLDSPIGTSVGEPAPASHQRVRDSADGSADRHRLIGGLAGALIGVIVALAISRRDRRLRKRDEIANSVGIPGPRLVPGRPPVRRRGLDPAPAGVQAAAVHAWRLRTALRRVGVPDDSLSNGHDGGSSSLAVLSLVLRSRRARARSPAGRLRRLPRDFHRPGHRPAAGRERRGHAAHRVRGAAARLPEGRNYLRGHRL